MHTSPYTSIIIFSNEFFRLKSDQGGRHELESLVQIPRDIKQYAIPDINVPVICYNYAELSGRNRTVRYCSNKYMYTAYFYLGSSGTIGRSTVRKNGTIKSALVMRRQLNAYTLKCLYVLCIMRMDIRNYCTAYVIIAEQNAHNCFVLKKNATAINSNYRIVMWESHALDINGDVSQIV